MALFPASSSLSSSTLHVVLLYCYIFFSLLLLLLLFFYFLIFPSIFTSPTRTPPPLPPLIFMYFHCIYFITSIFPRVCPHVSFSSLYILPSLSSSLLPFPPRHATPRDTQKPPCPASITLINRVIRIAYVNYPRLRLAAVPLTDGCDRQISDVLSGVYLGAAGEEEFFGTESEELGIVRM